MATPAELLAQSLAKLQTANRIDGSKNSYRKDNPAEYAAVMAYLNGGARPNATSDMGLGLVLEEDARRALVVPPPNGAASVDLNRNPIPPQGGTVVNLSSPLTISSTVTDVTYNVTAAISPAITVTSTGRMERCVLHCNGFVTNGVTGAGTVKDVLVDNALDSGFIQVSHFEGCCKTSRCDRGFFLTGSGVTLPADALLKADDADSFGIFLRDLSNSTFLGAIAGINAGRTSGKGQATGVEFWANVSNCSFNILIGNANPGYGVAIYGAGTLNNTITEIYCDAQAAGGDPGLSIGGGANNNTISKCTVLGYAVGCIMGEDVDPSPHHNRVKTLAVTGSAYPGIIFDRGAYSNVIGETGGAKLTSVGSAGVDYLGAVAIANRPGQAMTPPHDNQVLGLNQIAGALVPEYAVHCGSGTANNLVTGTATSWSIAKTLNQGTGNTISV